MFLVEKIDVYGISSIMTLIFSEKLKLGQSVRRKGLQTRKKKEKEWEKFRTATEKLIKI